MDGSWTRKDTTATIMDQLRKRKIAKPKIFLLDCQPLNCAVAVEDGETRDEL